tara:strand:- start:1339 stop:2508 length:1170 start_codon:yes stop_codon:yes gene_type:complete
MNPMLQQSSRLKLELLSNGVDVLDEPDDVGGDVKEEHRALFDARLVPTSSPNIPPEIVLPGDIVSKTVYRQDSPYILVEEPDGLKLKLKAEGETVSRARFPPRPKFYNNATSSGTPMKQVTQILGLDTLGIIINSYCSRVGQEKECAVCNIHNTTKKDDECVRPLTDIVESVSTAHKERAFHLINLTGGTFNDIETELVEYTKVAARIRRIMGVNGFLPGVTSFTPPPTDLIRRHADEFRQANFDMLTYNLEAWDENILKDMFPGKHDLGGRKHFITAAKETMDILGEGHVGIILMSGPWENVKSLLDGSRQIAREGILPIPVVFHSGDGMRYPVKSHTSVPDLLRLYRGIHSLYKEFNLVKSPRIRPAGSEHSFRNSLINEAVLGYLN